MTDPELEHAVEWVKEEVLMLKTYKKDKKWDVFNGERANYAIKHYQLLIEAAEKLLMTNLPTGDELIKLIEKHRWEFGKNVIKGFRASDNYSKDLAKAIIDRLEGKGEIC